MGLSWNWEKTPACGVRLYTCIIHSRMPRLLALPFEILELVQGALGLQPLTSTKINVRQVCTALADHRGATYRHLLRDVRCKAICATARDDPDTFLCALTRQLIATHAAPEVMGQYGCALPTQLYARVHRAVYEVLRNRRGVTVTDGAIEICNILQESTASIIQLAQLDDTGVKWVVDHLALLLRQVDHFIDQPHTGEHDRRLRLQPYHAGVCGAMQRGLLRATTVPA